MENSVHSFYIPVMGTGFTIDTPIKVAHYGINSVISIVDDGLIEKMRKHYCEQRGAPFMKIPLKDPHHRSERIRLYLNLVKEIVDENFEQLKQSKFEPGSDLARYFDMLPRASKLFKDYEVMCRMAPCEEKFALQLSLKDRMRCGAIDVNLITELDNAIHTRKGEELPEEYNDAHAAIQGFVESDLNSSLIFSGGFKPGLFSYLAQFKEFWPDEEGNLNKKVVIKTTDFRMAVIKSSFLAKKGIWVSEFRIESGVNSGGHAFMVDGKLMGVVLKEFAEGKKELLKDNFKSYKQFHEKAGRKIPDMQPKVTFTAQGGIGNTKEHRDLLQQYQLDAAGWGSPFLLVPEAVNMDPVTQKLLQDAGDEELEIQDISPLGVPFRTLLGTTKELERVAKELDGHPGSPCPRKFFAGNTEFSENPICVSSRQYQTAKLEQINQEKISEEERKEQINAVTEKTCLCLGLSTPALIANEIPHRQEGDGVLVCPGPNLAYFDKVVPLTKMVGHIYGRDNVLDHHAKRPHMFVKELQEYVKYIEEQEKIEKNPDRIEELKEFAANLFSGIQYYYDLFSGWKGFTDRYRVAIFNDLKAQERKLQDLFLD